MDQQLPKITQDKPKGEAQINDADIKKHAPDLVNERGGMAQDIQIVHQVKPRIDQEMQKIADATGAQMTSRVKNPKQIVRKVVQKRMEDRNYQLSDINDLLGYRFSYPKENMEGRVKKAIEAAAKQGLFTIIEQQARDKDTYHAYHFDVAFPLGQGKNLRSEIQLMTDNSEGQAAVTHDAHFVYGEDVPKHVEKKLDKQTKQVDEMPPIKAQQVADTLVGAREQNGDKTLPHKFVQKTIDKASITK